MIDSIAISPSLINIERLANINLESPSLVKFDVSINIGIEGARQVLAILGVILQDLSVIKEAVLLTPIEQSISRLEAAHTAFYQAQSVSAGLTRNERLKSAVENTQEAQALLRSILDQTVIGRPSWMRRRCLEPFVAAVLLNSLAFHTLSLERGEILDEGYGKRIVVGLMDYANKLVTDFQIAYRIHFEQQPTMGGGVLVTMAMKDDDVLKFKWTHVWPPTVVGASWFPSDYAFYAFAAFYDAWSSSPDPYGYDASIQILADKYLLSMDRDGGFRKDWYTKPATERWNALNDVIQVAIKLAEIVSGKHKPPETNPGGAPVAWSVSGAVAATARLPDHASRAATVLKRLEAIEAPAAFSGR